MRTPKDRQRFPDVLTGAAAAHWHLHSVAMGIDAALILLSLLSFVALIVSWIAAPLHSEARPSEPVAESARQTAAIA